MNVLRPHYRERRLAVTLLSVVALIIVFQVTIVSIVVSVKDILVGISATGDPLLPVKQIYWALRANILSPSTTTVLFYVGVPVLFAFQRLIPAVRTDQVFSRNLMCDALWMLLHGWMVATVILIFIASCREYISPWIEPFRYGFLSSVPAWAEVVAGYLLIELLGWFSHFLRHKIRVLWVFHEVHHSQTHMNPLTLFRVHPVDYLMSEVIILLPSIFFEETLGIVLAYLTISRVHDAMTHSNLKTNLGWLRFIFVTPQSHRVHHSAEAAYYNMNYGVTLSIWDRLFGTHSPSDFVYPKTGIPDHHFPTEDEQAAARVPLTLLRQLVYPFFKALRVTVNREP